MRQDGYAADVVSVGDKFFGTDQAGKTKNFNADSVKEFVGGAIGAYEKYKEFQLSFMQIRNLASSPVELLPAEVNLYYDWKVTLEFTAGNTAFDTTGNDILAIFSTNGSDEGVVFVSGSALSSNTLGEKFIGTLVGGTPGFNTELVSKPGYNSSLLTQSVNKSLSIYNPDGNYTQGNGTMLVKLWYSEKTFGSAL